MKNTLIKSFVVALVAAALPLASFAANKKSADDATEAPKNAEKKSAEAGSKFPYRGTILAVDASAKTFTLKGKEKDRVFQITDTTKITNDGAPADMSAIAAGQAVRGQVAKNGDKWDAASVMLGAKPETTKGAPAAAATTLGKTTETVPENKK